MKKILLPIVGIIVAAAAVYGGIYVWKNYKGALPALRNPSGNITDRLPSSDDPNLPEAMNQTDFPLKLPKGFAISVFAKNLPGARVMVIDGQNNMWVSQTGEGKVVMINKEGEVINVHQNLNKPHGLAVDNNNFLYIAEENRISKISLSERDALSKIADLPKGGRHFTRTLAFGPDGRLYVSIGSSCDVCNEKDERLAAIYSMNKDGSDFKQVAKGLRNSVFF